MTPEQLAIKNVGKQVLLGYLYDSIVHSYLYSILHNLQLGYLYDMIGKQVQLGHLCNNIDSHRSFQLPK